jgi:RNA polymerase sigma-70 factor (ECF subfamily)
VTPDAPQPGPATTAAVEEVARSSYGRLVAYLASRTGDIAGAEDALADAFVAALRTWPTKGVPARPDSWLLTAARRTLIDAARRRDTARRAVPEVARVLAERADPAAGSDIPDVRLQLMFACTHPAIGVGVRSPLMLQAVLGLDAARIAAVFLVAPTTMGQRLVRAKAKIATAGVPFAIPPARELPARVGAVLDAVYAAYTAGWDGDGEGDGGDLTDEAVRLARLLVTLLPDDPEVRGLLALLLHSHARRPARRDGTGAYVALQDQDTTLWSRPLVAEAEEQLARAAAVRSPGPYQLMAAVQSVHNRRAVTGTTDHRAVAQLYEGLVRLTPTVGAHVARAAAWLAAGDHTRALAVLDALPGSRTTGYQPYWATRAAVLDALGDRGAGVARERAIALAVDPAVRAHLSR